MSIFKFAQCLCVFLLCLQKILIPLLIELSILFNMSSFTLFPLLCLIENQFLLSSFIVLNFEFIYSIQCHFCFNILTFCFTSYSVLFKNLNEICNVIRRWIFIKHLLRACLLFHICQKLIL